ncbi:DUF2244 domain-containing protein [Duganella sp. BJB488]|uniref:DUF2244 domain-containing protein n=1 Tax=unclassified Duganella TaxID=2636909 RepID=UPI000E34E276|nr:MULTISPECIES: DUF2244 domain-containing protein [unclassified Duganella]RFP22946.1 DUF2244 domain-containing protein [Duganella sp. BJB489]RFP24978.1 DUF2244 domain-containing protein [Duganella sp. BJB488]RFP33945.1 DUF2244 domain-containing protein [Duganella sp. BJB480]
MPRDVPSEPRSWLLERRCTLTKRQLVLVFASLCVPSALVALAFLWQGYWYVLAYAALEQAALAACLRHCARHRGDYDRIDISPAAIVVEQRRGRQCRARRLHRLTTRLLPPRRDNDPIQLEDRGEQVEVGRFLGAAQRRRLAAELARCLGY